MGRWGGSPTLTHRILTPVSIPHITSDQLFSTALCPMFLHSYVLIDVSSIYVKERNTLFWTPRFSLQYSQSVDAFNSTPSSNPYRLYPNFPYSCIKSNQTRLLSPLRWHDQSFANLQIWDGWHEICLIEPWYFSKTQRALFHTTRKETLSVNLGPISQLLKTLDAFTCARRMRHFWPT